jgi:predicted naringenin-chalcone synthase
MTVFVTDFERVPPPLVLSQTYAMDWLKGIHSQAIRQQNEQNVDENLALLEERFAQIQDGISQIQARGSWCEDYAATEELEKNLYPSNRPEGACVGARVQAYATAVQGILERLYPHADRLPDEIIHVSCTGYISPSPPQRLVANRKTPTRVTHLYHMGCGAALPALRTAAAATQSHPWRPQTGQVDCVHTELCSFHLNPAQHELSQLVIQSLFGDGAIRYRVRATPGLEAAPALALLAMHEELIPDTAYAMSWELKPWGFAMGLSKHVPVLIRRALPSFLKRLSQEAQLDLADLLEHAYWAIHPGGPKIVEQIAEHLGLSEQQTHHSRQILRLHGNMSSATLPHIWQAILHDTHVPPNSLVVTLAFSPGLTLAGAVLRKQTG